MELFKQAIEYARNAQKVRTQAVAEGELTPPATLPAIARVLCVNGRVSATGQPMDDRLTVEGSVTISVMYVCDSGKLHAFESVALFKHNVDMPGCQSHMHCAIYASLGEIFHRTSGGGLHVRAIVDLVCETGDNSEVQVISSIKDAQTRTLPLVAVTKRSSNTEIDLRDDIRMPRSVDKLLCIDGYARVQSVSLENSSAIVEGVLRLSVSFCTPDGLLVQSPASIPFSQKISVPDGTTSAWATARILSISSGLSDEDIAAIDARVEIQLSAEISKEYEVINDAYSTDRNLECQQICIPMRSSLHTDCRCTLRQTLVVPSGMPAADRVLIAILRPVIESAVPNEGTLSLKGSIRASIVYQCREGNVHGFESSVPFKCEGEAAILKPHMEVFAKADAELGHAGASGVEIPLQVALDIVIDAFSFKNICAVANIEESERSPNYCGPMIYFPEKGESMWDIGKRFGLTVDELRHYNPEATDQPSAIVLNLKKTMQ